MAINIGINGFGRIGRLVFRSAINNDDFNVISINDLLDINHLAYLLKYDSVHGTFDGSVEISENKLIVNGKTVRITAERDPSNIDWSTMGVDIVAECMEFFPISSSKCNFNSASFVSKFTFLTNNMALFSGFMASVGPVATSSLLVTFSFCSCLVLSPSSLTLKAPSGAHSK